MSLLKYKSRFGQVVTAFALVATVALGQTLGVVSTASAAAATIAWSGAGDGIKFSDAANWTGNKVPANGDALTFDAAKAPSEALNNDIDGLNVSGITFTGNNKNNGYTVEGKQLTAAGNIANNGSSYAMINADLTLSGDTTVKSVSIGKDAKVKLGAHNLTVSTNNGCGASVGVLSGSGVLTTTGAAVNITGDNTGFTGSIVIDGKAAASKSGLGSADVKVTKKGELALIATKNTTYGNKFELNSSKALSSQVGPYACFGGGGAPKQATITLNGGVTLNSDLAYDGYHNLVIKNPFEANGHKVSTASGSDGTVTTPEGESEVPTTTVHYKGDKADKSEVVGNKVTGYIDGTRGTIQVNNNGALKGNGTVDYLYVSEGGVVAPGNSPGAITVRQTATLNAGSTYNVELKTVKDYDQLRVGKNHTANYHAVSLDGSNLALSLLDGYSIKKGDKFTIVDNQSKTDVSGTFAGLKEGAKIKSGSITFSISYTGGDGNDIVLTALNSGGAPGAPDTGFQTALKTPAIVALVSLAVVSVAIVAGRKLLVKQQ